MMRDSPPAPLVSIRNLTIDATTAQGTAHILRGVDLDIGRGRILGVVGESGSGKSSLASALIGLLSANIAVTAGQIDFDGADLVKLSERQKHALRGHRIAMIFQDPMTALNPLFTIATHLVDVIQRRSPDTSRRFALEKAEAMLTTVGIADAALRLKAYPHQLSGGMRQRVMIAMALLVAPDLLLADEPTTALDATVEAQIVRLLSDLRRDFAGSIVFISHHLGLVAELCDDVCVMYGGTIIEAGPVADVLAQPKHPYTAALLACEIEHDTPDGRLVSVPGDVPDPRADVGGCIFAPRCGHAVERCQTEVPRSRDGGVGRTVACHRSEELHLVSAQCPPATKNAIEHFAETGAQPLVVFESVSVVFDGRVRALDDVSLKLSRGEIVGLVGESGSGKTTLCRSLIGLTAPTSGTVSLDGQTIATHLATEPLAFRRRIQMLLQDAVASLSPRMTVGQALEEPLRIHRLPLADGRERLGQILRRLGLSPEILAKFPHQVSGGQARRIGVARALVMQPQVIIADEPTAGLDVSVQGELLNLLLDLQLEFDLTYLLVSHNLNVIRRVTTRTAVMYLGQIVEDGPTSSLFERPAHPYAAALLSTNPSIDPARRRNRIVLSGEIPSAVNPPSGCRFHTRCPLATQRCKVEMPPLQTVAPGRSARCHFPFTLGRAEAR
jgi:peptide/nickel transport system ATP-binding protein